MSHRRPHSNYRSLLLVIGIGIISFYPIVCLVTIQTAKINPRFGISKQKLLTEWFTLSNSRSQEEDIVSSSSSSSSSSSNVFHADIGILGGGASGMFAAASAVSQYHEQFRSLYYSKEINSTFVPPLSSPTIVILESTSNLMTKIQLSGGGRCNVLHDTNKPLSTLLQGYPRGKKELQGIMTSEFSPVQARTWFEDQGVQLKTEGDGRMFPITDSSQTIVDTIYKAVVDPIPTSHKKNKLDSILMIPTPPPPPPPRVQIERNQCIVSVQHITNTTTNRNITLDYFQVITSLPDHSNRTWNFHSIIFATGSSRIGYDIVASLGHDIISPVPSLFTLATKPLVQPGGVFYDLAGITVPKVIITWKLLSNQSNPTNTTTSSSNSHIIDSSSNKNNKRITTQKKKNTPLLIQQEGPLLITHAGISGPAPLKLSAFGARAFHQAQYKCNLTIHWLPDLGSTKEQVETVLWSFVSMYPKRKVSSYFPLQDDYDHMDDSELISPSSSSSMNPILPKRLWTALVHTSGVLESTNKGKENHDMMTWGDMSKSKIRQLSKTLCEFTLPVSGKGIFKDEFVTAGGICLKSINMKCMESKIHSGLYFCGEILNVDGVTGGYNFMNCWSTGYVAGKNAMNRYFV